MTRLLYSEWFPQVYWDVHQQGMDRERIFVPPFRDPLDPNLDPGILAGIDQLGTRALLDMTREGLTGVSTGVSYDMWWNGGNRNVPVRHNVLGLLTEAASVRIASPVFLPIDRLSAPRGVGEYAPSMRFLAPWPGGWWHLRDVVDYEHAFARSLLGSLAREPGLWLDLSLSAARRAVRAGREDSPRGWILPPTTPDREAVRRLVDALLLSGVEVEAATAPLEADGRTWPEGSLVVRRDQPYGQHVKDLFELQRYPDGDPPYDVAGWTLPLLLGVRRVEVAGPLEATTRRVTDATDALRGFPRRFEEPLGDQLDGDDWRRAFERLAAGKPIGVEENRVGEGRLVLGGEDAAIGNGDGTTRIERMPRVGVYAPWSGLSDEGWMRWVLDTHAVPYVTVRNETLRAGALGELLDVLVLPSLPGPALQEGRREGSVPARYAGGIGPEGAAAVEDFVRRGGTVVAMDQSARWVVDLLELPLASATAGTGFACPGSVLRAVPEPSALTAGLPASLAVFFSRGEGWNVPTEAPKGRDGHPLPRPEVLLRYAPTELLLSGWVTHGEALAGSAAWVRARHGTGTAILFGFRPQYRGWTQASFPLLFRSLLYGRSD